MQTPDSKSRIIRFGTFELNLQEGRLTKSGLRVRLQGQPFQILVLLLERAGQVVTRDEIRQTLWSGQTFVEFDDALNTAMGKLRAAIGDTAENPRFVETVPRRGYRFIAPVTMPPQLEVPADPVPPAVSSEPADVQSRPDEAPVSQRAPQLPTERKSNLGRWYVFGSIATFLVVATIVIYWKQRPHGFQTGVGDTVVLADFVNTTGESVFDDALRQALEIGLGQSPAIKIMSERKASLILTQMGHSAEDRMTGKTAIEVCQRAGGKVTIQGSIASLGTVYLVGLAAIRCDNGEPIANEQVEASRKEDVVDAVGRVTAQLRSRLGESLPSIQKYNAPLEQATTASLDALNAYSLALTTWDKKGDLDSLPIFKKAVELDPNFAQAHSGLATVYSNLGQDDLAREHATRAYELRAHVTQAEKSSIEARYYEFVTGELEKAEEVRALQVQNYPESPNGFNHLGDSDHTLGRYEQAVQDYRRALVLDPTRGGTHSELAYALLALNRLDEAVAVLADADKRSLQTDSLTEANYRVAFLRGDDRKMAQLLQQSSTRPETQALLLAEQSDTEAYFGRFKKSVDLSKQASTLMEQQGDKDSAARYLARAAVREAEVGESATAHELIVKAQKLSRDQDIVVLGALTAARLGEREHAETLSRQLNIQSPAGTYVQKYWLPIVRAELDLGKGQPSQAIDDLSLLNPPLEFGGPLVFPVATLYPAYVRGEAYLAVGDGPHAATEFQKLRDHPDLLANYPLESISLAQLARAHERSGDREKARKEYQDFLRLWKGADPDIRLLKDAQAAYSKLQ